MIILAKRYLTKLYVNNVQKQPLQEKYEALGKMVSYLNKVRRQQNLKRQVLNRYITSRYLQLSRAFLEIQDSFSISTQTMLDLKDQFNQTYKISVFQKQKLALKKLVKIFSKRLKSSFGKIRIKAATSNSKINKLKNKPFTEERREGDAPIFANCLNQYLFVLGNISTQGQILKRKRTTIFKTLLNKNVIHHQRKLRIYFKRFTQILPQNNFEIRLSITKNLQYLEQQKEDLSKSLH